MSLRLPDHNHRPDFDNFLNTLTGTRPFNPVIGEFFIGNTEVLEMLAGPAPEKTIDETKPEHLAWTIRAWNRAGYDYVTALGSRWVLNVAGYGELESRSLNDGALITDRDTFERYVWTNPDDFDYSTLGEAEHLLADGMGLVARSPTGLLEYAEAILGYENMCYLLVDDPELVQDVFDEIGRRLLKYYQICLEFPAVGACLVNDDWGFKSQTMLSPDHMRRLVFPWHRRIVAAIHEAGRPAILHSCGNLTEVMDDVIDGMGYDAKHSFEDAIFPVEEAWEQFHNRIGIIGGIDLDFLVRGEPDQIRQRATTLLRITADEGRYALGSGNSIPHYVPVKNYIAMLEAVYDIW